MKDVIIGIDAGTSVIKSIAFSLTGEQLGGVARDNEYALLDGGGAEQDATLTWQKTADTLQELVAKIPNLASRIAAIAVTGQGDGTWLFDREQAPVGDALLWLDARAASMAEELARHDANRHRYQLTGTGLAACQQGTQLRWLKANRPEQIEQAAHAMHCKDWLYYNLTGDIATDPSEGNFTFGNFRTREYSDDVIDALGLSDCKSLLPPMVEGTQHQGKLRPDVASRVGLPEGVPVVLGYVDVICSSLAAGLYSPSGSAGCTIIGSTGVHMRLARSAADVGLNDECTGYTMCMPIDNCCAQLQSNMAATLNIDWLLDLAVDLFDKVGVSKSRSDVLAQLDEWVASAAPGAVLYQPYISEAGERGPFVDVTARAGFTGLSTRHGYADLARAVFEGLSMAGRDCYGAMGSVPDDVVLTGGAARSDQLLQILASTLDASVSTSDVAEAGAAGAAMMAAVSIGHYSHMDHCVADWVTPHLGEPVQADPELVACYESLFPLYKQTRVALRPIWQGLHPLQDKVNDV